jgi:hypothetical protein
MLSFQSTPDYPAPCYLPNANECDDLAAVLAGTKRSAIIHLLDHIINDEVFKALLDFAKQQGFFIVESKHKLFIGDVETVNQLEKVVERVAVEIDEKVERCSEIGRLLGYSEEAIHDFVEYGIKKDMTFREREIRRKLHKVYQ